MTLFEMVNSNDFRYLDWMQVHKVSEFAYLLKLQDQILEYTEKNDQNLGNFLGFWEDKGRKASLDLPKNINAIRLLSIHKSKGLQAPVVIMPYANLDFKGSHKTIVWANWNEGEMVDSEFSKFEKFGTLPHPTQCHSRAIIF